MVQKNWFIISLRRLSQLARCERRALSHGCRCARHRIGEIEIGNRRAKRRLVDPTAKLRKFADVGRIRGLDGVDQCEMRMLREHRAAQIRERVIGQLRAHRVGERPQDRPILPRIAGGKAARFASCGRPSVLT